MNICGLTAMPCRQAKLVAEEFEATKQWGITLAKLTNWIATSTISQNTRLVSVKLRDPHSGPGVCAMSAKMPESETLQVLAE